MYHMDAQKVTWQELKDSLYSALEFRMKDRGQDYLTTAQLYDAGWRHLFSLRIQYNGRGEELFLSVVKEKFYFDSLRWRRL